MFTIPNAFAETLAETLADIGIEQTKVAQLTGIPAPHLSALKNGKRRVTPEYDLRLGRFFGTTPGFWLRLQLQYDLRMAQDRLKDTLQTIPPFAA
jgi:antitoxin HigA-1